MHWGVRRGSNSESSGGEKHKMTTDQLIRAKEVTDHSSKITEQGGKINKSISVARAAKNQEDIAKLSDAELKAKVARMNMEQQYANLSANQISKGQAYAKSALDVGGSVLAIGSSAIGIALAMKQLKGN